MHAWMMSLKTLLKLNFGGSSKYLFSFSMNTANNLCVSQIRLRLLLSLLLKNFLSTNIQSTLDGGQTSTRSFLYFWNQSLLFVYNSNRRFSSTPSSLQNVCERDQCVYVWCVDVDVWMCVKRRERCKHLGYIERKLSGL